VVRLFEPEFTGARMRDRGLAHEGKGRQCLEAKRWITAPGDGLRFAPKYVRTSPVGARDSAASGSSGSARDLAPLRNSATML